MPMIVQYPTVLAAAGILAVCLVTGGCASSAASRADRLAAKGDWDGAVALYREAVKGDPLDVSLQRRLEQAKTYAAERHYVDGQRYLKERRIPEALEHFKLAVGLNPSRSEHHAGLGDALRLKEAREQAQAADKLRGLGRAEEALAAYERAVELDPDLARALEGVTAITAQRRDEKKLGASGEPITLRFQNARMREVFEVLARAGGLNVVFDKDIRDDPLTIFIKDMPFEEALNLILSTNNLFVRRIGPDTLLVVPNTKPKQDQYQDLMIRTFYLSNSKAKDMVNLLRTMLESKRVYVNEPINAVVIRDTPDKLRLAERVILANDRREAEVELDLEVLEVDRSKSLTYGLNFAKTAGAGLVPPGFTGSLSTSTSQFTYRQLFSLGPGSYLFTLPVNVLLDFFKEETDAKTLASPKLRVVNGKQALVNVGDKQPILLSTTNVLPGQAATGAVPTTSTVTSIEFKDVGVKLTVEPTIHLLDELTLKLKIEVNSLGDQVTLQSSPLIQQFKFGTRTAETILNMKDGEAVILAGLIQDQEKKTRDTVPWLGDIPLLGRLFSHITTSTVTTEVVLTITPRIVRSLSVPGPETQAFWSGTEGFYATSPLFTNQKPAGLFDPRSEPAGPLPQGAPMVPRNPSSEPVPPGVPQMKKESVPVQPGERTPSSREVPPGAVLEVRPSATSAKAGQDIQIELWETQLRALPESNLVISYDPQILEFLQAREGTLLQQEGAAALVIVASDPRAGRVELRLKRNGAPLAEEGILATLTFRAKAAGSSSVSIQEMTVSGGGGASQPVLIQQGQVRVS